MSTTETKTGVTTDAGIAISNRLFARVSQIGMCDAKGRTIFAAGFNSKWIAEPNQPVRTLILPLVSELLGYAKYTDKAEFEADLAALRKYVDGLYLDTPAPSPRAGEGEETK